MEINYTLGKNYVLRQNQKDSFMLFNTLSSKEYDISQEFYYVLKMFKYNILSLDYVYQYFEKKGIDINISKFEENLHKLEFNDLLEKSDHPNSNGKDIIIEGLPLFVNYTPQRIDLVLTEKCNLQCKHCFQDSTPFKPSDFSSIERLTAFCDEIEDLNINIIFPLGRGGGNNKLCLSQEQILCIKNKLSKLRDLYPNKMIRLNDAEEILSYEDDTEEIYCSGGTKTLCVNPQLEVYPCSYAFGMDQFKMGIVGNEKLIDIWQKRNWNIFRGETKLKDLKSCHSCAFNKKCTYRNCRIKPIYQGLDFYSSISYCKLKKSYD